MMAPTKMTKQPTLERPPEKELERAIALLEPWRKLVAPKFLGLDRVPAERPLLFVGNHTLYGVLDIGFLWRELLVKHDIFLRGLADHAHFRIPFWRDLMARWGAVDGTRENCAHLMAHGETILVFPGGAREVAKRRGEAYQLIWKERIGFARMAIAHGCTIVPFASVGVDDAFEIVLDANDLLASPLGGLLRKLNLREDFIPPLARGLGPMMLPRAERFYFEILPPIETRGMDDTEDAARVLRDQVRSAVQTGLDNLIALRERDPKRKLGPRLLSGLLPRRKASP